MLEVTDYDYAIAGAGLSGLALANSLSKIGLKDTKPKSICLIEPRTEYIRDHTWCFWNNVLEKLSLPETKKWHKWHVRYGSKTSIRGSKQYPYTCILADAYYKHALSQLQDLENVHFFLGESLQNIAYSDSKLAITTDQRNINCQFLFDSRPPQLLSSEFKQDFLGWHIRSDKEIFDEGCVTLMDFTASTKVDTFTPSGIKGFHFFYVLPFSSTEALVESVWIGFERLAEEQHQGLLTNYLLDQYGLASFEKIHTEHGCIPMHHVHAETADKRHSLIGVGGGLARSSTGYAFAAIHHSSTDIASSIKRRRWPNTFAALSPTAALLDKVLLSYLKQNPADGPLLLSALFERVDADVLVRFLCDRSSLVDNAAIFAVMPKKVELSAIMAQMIL